MRTTNSLGARQFSSSYTHRLRRLHPWRVNRGQDTAFGEGMTEKMWEIWWDSPQRGICFPSSHGLLIALIILLFFRMVLKKSIEFWATKYSRWPFWLDWKCKPIVAHLVTMLFSLALDMRFVQLWTLPSICFSLPMTFTCSKASGRNAIKVKTRWFSSDYL